MAATQKVGLLFLVLTSVLVTSSGYVFWSKHQTEAVQAEQDFASKAKQRLEKVQLTISKAKGLVDASIIGNLSGKTAGDMGVLEEKFFETGDLLEGTLNGLTQDCAQRPCAELATQVKEHSNAFFQFSKETIAAAATTLSKSQVLGFVEKEAALHSANELKIGELNTWFDSLNAAQDAKLLSAKKSEAWAIYLCLGASFLVMVFGFFAIKLKIFSPLSKTNRTLGNKVELLIQNSGKLTTVARDLSQVVTTQESAVTESVAAMTEVQNVVRKSQAHLDETDSLAHTVRHQGLAGKRAFEEIELSVEGLMGLRADLQSLERVMEEIAERTQAINGIVFKTQILSFNASIEATRAGAQGKGFTVVAAEVGRLADLSGKASEDIGRIVSESRRRVREVVEGISKGMEKASSVTVSSREQIQGLLENVEVISSKVAEVRSGALEQSAGIDEIVKGMSELSRASGHSAELAKESRNISVETTACANEINEIFQLSANILFGGASTKSAQQESTLLPKHPAKQAQSKNSDSSNAQDLDSSTAGESEAPDSAKLSSLAERIIAQNNQSDRSSSPTAQSEASRNRKSA